MVLAMTSNCLLFFFWFFRRCYRAMKEENRYDTLVEESQEVAWHRSVTKLLLIWLPYWEKGGNNWVRKFIAVVQGDNMIPMTVQSWWMCSWPVVYFYFSPSRTVLHCHLSLGKGVRSKKPSRRAELVVTFSNASFGRPEILSSRPVCFAKYRTYQAQIVANGKTRRLV